MTVPEQSPADLAAAEAGFAADAQAMAAASAGDSDANPATEDGVPDSEREFRDALERGADRPGGGEPR